MMVSNPSETSRSRRTTLACENCREKKLRCDGAKPVCKSCRLRGQECSPQTLNQQPRPTNKRIRELEDENRRLLQLLNEASAQESYPSEETATFPAVSAGPHETGQVQERDLSDHLVSHPNEGQSLEKPQGFTIIINQKPVTQNPVAEAPQNNHSSYHGPTSVLFEEIPRLQGGNNAEERFSEDTEQARYRLVAESARQRQLEYVNVSTGRLDFDGVEPELGMQLLSIFWTRQPHAGLIVYRTAFMRDMACGGPYFSRLLLNAMYYAASKHSPAKMIRQNAADRATSGWSFRQRFDELLRASFDKTHITTIQALLIMASSLFTRCDERSISWLYAGNAFNMIIDSGIHVESPTSKTMASEDLEIRRRVYWGAFMIDKIQCLYQGRHPCLRMSDTNVPLVFIDDYEELELFPGASFCDPAQPSTSPSYHITTLKSLCRLSIVMERIHNKIYAVSHLTQTSENLCKEALDLQLELEAWRQCLPTHLDFITYKTKMSPLPYNLSMLAVYNVLVILVHRLLLSDVSLSAGSIASQALATCWKAASEITHILRVHEKLYKPLSETFSLCYAAYIGATVLIHIIVRHGDQFGAVEALRICLNCLSKHQAFYSAAKRASSIIAKLMERAAVHICECGGLSGQCQLQHSAYMNAVSPNSNQVLPGGIGSDGHAANGSPNSHLIALPNLESLEFDVDLAFQDFRRLQETTDSRLGMVEYPMLYDLYHNSPQENAVESTKQAATM